MKDTKRTYCNEVSFGIDAREKDYLYVITSQIPGSGNGLFTAIPIFKDDIIALFRGEQLTHKEAQKRAAKAENDYFISMPDGSTLDSMNVPCFAKYANDCEGFTKTKFKNNAKITLDEHDNVCIVAIKSIKAGAEIFCSYGKPYWKARH